MKAFKIQRILIPIDFSDTSMLAIEHAAFTAQLFKAELILLHVVERLWEKFSIVVPELTIPTPEGYTDSLEKKLEETADNIRSKHGVKSHCITCEGNILTEIMKISKEQDVDLVVMGTHGIAGIAEFFVGSNTYKVVNQSKCPVLSVQTSTSHLGYQNILLPIDNSAHSRQKVNHAVVLAKNFASKLHILGLDMGDMDEVESGQFEIRLDQIVDYAKKCGVICDKRTVKGSNQAKMTLDYAGSSDSDLLVIMTDQEESISGRLLGTYAQQIVNHSKIPVLSIHPIKGVTHAWENPY